MACMIYQQYTTAIRDGYLGRSDVLQHLEKATAFREWIESLEIALREGFRDLETGSLWNVLGQAVEGELSGERLTVIPHLDTFWFAWLSYNPATVLISS